MSIRATQQFPGYRIAKRVLFGFLLFVAVIFRPAPAAAELSTADPLGFFTNLSSRLLQSQMGLSLNRIQIYPTNEYTPAVHRLLQVTANILDATTNRFNTNYPYLPSVFRPLFTNDSDRIFICGYEEEAGPGYATNAWRDLNDPAARAALQSRDYGHGVPVIIGVKKGFPSFNEFAMQTVFQISRMLQITRPSLIAPMSTWQTNQMFILGISNVVGVELWNSYRSNYARAVDIYSEALLTVTLTNNSGLLLTQQRLVVGNLSQASNNWSGTGPASYVNPSSFLVPVRTNLIFLPDSIYRHGSQSFTTNLGGTFETGLGFPIPHWGISLTGRLRVFMVDQETQRLVDCVTLEGLSGLVDLSEAIRDPNLSVGFDGLWSTNFLHSTSVPQGVFNQIDIALGNHGADSTIWRLHTYVTSSIPAKVDNFRAFFGLSPLYDPNFVNTNLVLLCPFTPTRRISASWTWQANDPLVRPARTALQHVIERPALTLTLQTIKGIGSLNDRFLPWGGNPFAIDEDPDSYNAALKDPLIRKSDDWTFPVSEPLSLAMLGLVHRGTPWQTFYLKSAQADDYTWHNWLLDADWQNSQLTHPRHDWDIAGLLAGLLNTNSPHDLLSINEPDAGAWRGRLDGMTVLTNTSPDNQLLTGMTPLFSSLVVSSNSPQAMAVVDGIIAARASQSGGAFRNLGDLLAVPELSAASPWLNQSTSIQIQRGISDEAYERIPSQLLSLVRADSVGAIAWSNGDCQIQFTGFDNFPYAVESSSNLVFWTSISTNYPTDGVFTFTNYPSSPGANFFRSVLLP